MPFIAGNWKMFKTGPEAVATAARLAELTSDVEAVEIMVAPTFLWHEPDDAVKAWLIDIAFEGHPRHVFAVTTGKRTPRPIDPDCVTPGNAWTESAYQASARGWTPDGSERTFSRAERRDAIEQTRKRVETLCR